MGTHPCKECTVADDVVVKSSLVASEAASPISSERSGSVDRGKVLHAGHTIVSPFPAQA